MYTEFYKKYPKKIKEFYNLLNIIKKKKIYIQRQFTFMYIYILNIIHVCI